MPRKGENIYKRKDGRWEARYIKGRSSTGKAIYGFVYGKTYKEAREKKKEALIQATPNSNAQNISSDTTFEIIADDWLLHKQSNVKESTFIKYKNLLISYLYPKFQNYPIEHLTSYVLEEYCNNMLSSGGNKGKGLSAKTVNDILSVIRSILCYAKRNGLSIKCDGNEFSIKQEAHVLQVLSIQEQTILCDYLQHNINPKNLGIIICLFTGLRIGELCALKWEDISFTENTIYVHNTLQRLQTSDGGNKKTKVIISTPKSMCSIRKIPVPDVIIEILKTNRRNSGFLLTGGSEDYVEPRVMEYHFKKVLVQCNLNDIKFHALRHTFATRCVELGFDVKSLSEILGHANISITLNRYVHPSMDLKRDNMKKLSNLFTVK